MTYPIDREPTKRKRQSIPKENIGRTSINTISTSPRELGPLGKLVNVVNSLGVALPILGGVMHVDAPNYNAEAARLMRAGNDNQSSLVTHGATAQRSLTDLLSPITRPDVTGGLKARKITIGQDQDPNGDGDGDGDEEPPRIAEVATPALDQQRSGLSAELLEQYDAALSSIPDNEAYKGMRGQIRSGELVFEPDIDGFTRVVIIDGVPVTQVWRTGMSPDNQDVEMGWMNVLTEHQIDFKGQSLIMRVESTPDGFTPRLYTDLELSEKFKENMLVVLENQFKDKNFNGMKVTFQLAGHFDKNEDNFDYMQVILPSSTLDGTTEIAAQFSFKGNNLFIRLYTDSRVSPDSQLQMDELFVSQLIAYGVVVFQSEVYRNNEMVELDQAVDIRHSEKANRIFRDLYMPLVMEAGEDPLSLTEMFSRTLVHLK